MGKLSPERVTVQGQATSRGKTAIFWFSSDGKCRVGKWEAGVNSEYVYISTSLFACWLHLTMCYLFTESFISSRDAKNDINIY